MKILYTIIAVLGSLTLSAQTESASKTFFSKSLKKTESSNQLSRTSVVNCGVDTIVYPYLKELVFTAPNDSFFIDAMVGNVRTASQAYHLTSPVNVHGVQFWGMAYSTGTSPQVLPVKAYLYAIDAQNMPTAVLDSAIVSITEQNDFYEAYFTTPHLVTGNFAVGVRSQLNDTLAVVTNNAGATWQSPQYGESLGWRRFGSGTWNSTLSFFGQDVEYMIFPIVSYSIASDFTADNDSTCVGETETFVNTSTGPFADRMFNLYAFDEYFGLATDDSSFTWNYGDNTGDFTSLNGSHSYTTSGNYTVELNAEIQGYYSTCSEAKTMNIEVMDQVTSSFTFDDTQSPTVDFTNTSIGDSAVTYDFGDGSTSTSQNPSHTYTSAGTYTVTLVTEGFCGTATSTQSIVINSTVGISENQVNVSLSYNQQRSLLNIYNKQNYDLVIYNVLGANVYNEQNLNGSSQINLNELPAGTYIAHISFNGTVKTLKFNIIK